MNNKVTRTRENLQPVIDGFVANMLKMEES